MPPGHRPLSAIAPSRLRILALVRLAALGLVSSARLVRFGSRIGATEISDRREPAVQLPVGAFVDAAHAGPRVAEAECSERPQELGIGPTGEPEDKCVRPLRRGSIADWQVELGAAS